MGAIIVLLWIMVGFRVLNLFLLQGARGMETKTLYTDGQIAWRSFLSVISAVILALAALALAGAFG